MSTKTISQGVEWKPRTVDESDLLPYSMGNHPWHYVHFAASWEWHDGLGAFLPQLGTLSRQPGVNGVDQNGDPTDAIGNLTARGGMVVQPNDPRLGKFAGYLVAYQCEGGRKHYAHRGTSYALRPGSRTPIVVPAPDYDAFRAHLTTVPGLIHPLDEHTIGAILEREESALARMERDFARDGNDYRREKVEAKRARLKKIRAAAEKALNVAAPAKPIRPRVAATEE